MNIRHSIREIKDSAFTATKANYGRLLLFSVISALLFAGICVANFCGLLPLLFLAPLTVGIHIFFFGICCGKDVTLGTMFDGFRSHFWKNVLLGLLYLVRVLLWSLCLVPGYLVMWAGTFLAGAAFFAGVLIYILGVLLIIAGYIPLTIALIRYSFAFNCMAENPMLFANLAIKKSLRITDGKVGKIFLFDLSFIGWYLLGFVTFGIAHIFIMPYLFTARMMLFNDLMECERESSGITETE